MPDVWCQLKEALLPSTVYRYVPRFTGMFSREHYIVATQLAQRVCALKTNSMRVSYKNNAKDTHADQRERVCRSAALSCHCIRFVALRQFSSSRQAARETGYNVKLESYRLSFPRLRQKRRRWRPDGRFQRAPVALVQQTCSDVGPSSPRSKQPPEDWQHSPCPSHSVSHDKDREPRFRM